MGGAIRAVCSARYPSLVAAALVLLGGALFTDGILAARAPVFADAHTSVLASAIQLGASPELDVSLSPLQTAFLQFDMSTLPGGISSADIGLARVRLYVRSVAAAGALEVRPVTDSWTESGITFENAPTLGPASSTFTVSPGARGTFVDVDVTSLVKSWIDGLAPNHGIAIVSSLGASVAFDSKDDATTSHAPELHVDLVAKAGPQGTTGAFGAPGADGETGPQG